MDISEKSQATIKYFLAEWWQSISWQVQQTVAGADIPHQDPDQLYDQLFGLQLREIAAAAEGLLPDAQRPEIYEAVQSVCEWMFARPGMPASYQIPAAWWATDMGSLCLRAHLWAYGDELVTMTQAAELTGRSVSALSQLVDRGKLTGYTDPDEPNPTKATRLSKAQVLALKTKPRK